MAVDAAGGGVDLPGLQRIEQRCSVKGETGNVCDARAEKQRHGILAIRRLHSAEAARRIIKDFVP